MSAAREAVDRIVRVYEAASAAWRARAGKSATLPCASTGRSRSP